MTLHVSPSADVVRPPPLRVVQTLSALDCLHADGTLDDRQRAAGLAYAALRRRFETAARSARRSGAELAMTEAAWLAPRRRHDALLGAAGFDRFLLDRLLLDNDPPLRCEIERVREVLDRLTLAASSAAPSCLRVLTCRRARSPRE